MSFFFFFYFCTQQFPNDILKYKWISISYFWSYILKTVLTVFSSKMWISMTTLQIKKTHICSFRCLNVNSRKDKIIIIEFDRFLFSLFILQFTNSCSSTYPFSSQIFCLNSTNIYDYDKFVYCLVYTEGTL